MATYELGFVDFSTIFGFLRWSVFLLLFFITAFFIYKKTRTNSKAWIAWSVITIIAAPLLILNNYKIIAPNESYPSAHGASEVPSSDDESSEKLDESQNSNEDDSTQSDETEKQKNQNTSKTNTAEKSSDSKSDSNSKDSAEPESNPDPEPLNEYEITIGDVKTINPDEYTAGATVKIIAAEKPGHSFSKWSSNQDSLDGSTDNPLSFVMPDEEIEIMPVYIKNKYIVKFLNYDGTELQSEEIEYGETPIYNKQTPIKSADNTYTYNFAGWDSEIAPVSESKNYIAKYDSNYINYTIIFNDDDGAELSKKIDYHYGDAIEVPANPTKEATVEYTYMFSGWTPEVVNVSGNATYTATYSQIKNKYTIKFLNYDGTELQSEEIEYGEVPVYNEQTPIKSADNTYTYNFAGWDKEIAAVTKAETYTATFNQNYIDYTVIFKNEDGTELSKKTNYHYGDTVEVPANPTKPSTAEYTYVFAGWNNDVIPVAGNATYTATYTAIKNEYTIKFLNYDGTILQSAGVKYGETPSYTGEEPTKPSTAQYSYAFSGWEPEISAVIGEATYTAKFSKSVNKYTIVWQNDDGTILETDKNIPYGETPSYDGATPTKNTDVEYTYTFSGWTPEVTDVSGNVTYIATYSRVKNKYTIKFLNYDGAELQSSEIEYGQMPSYTGEAPTKPSDNTYTYSFNGWGEELTPVSGAKSYTAVFTSNYINYHIVFMDDETVVYEKTDYHYGDTITIPDAPLKNDHTFEGWFSGNDVQIQEGQTVSGNITYYAHWITSIVCKVATKLHVTTCDSDPAGGGCVKNGFSAGDRISIGKPLGEDEIVPQHGTAYDCDVNNNGEIDVIVDDNGNPVLDDDGDTISAERFYYLGQSDGGYSSLIYYNLLPEGNSESIVYDEALATLPTATNSAWTNPHLRNIDGRVARFMKRSELDSSCISGGASQECKSYLTGDGKFLLENSAFTDRNRPDGIWLIFEDPNYVRIHAAAISITVGKTEKNAPKPVIEVPYSLIEKRNLPTKTITFESNGGTTVPDRTVEVGDMIGSLPTPEKEGYMFFGWYQTPELFDEVDPEMIVTNDATYYARWIENSADFPIEFFETNACTFNGKSVTEADPITGDHCKFADGVRTFIDTGVMLFSDVENGGVDNYDKDFELGFDIVSYNPKNQGSDNTQATFVNSKLEKASTFPGFVVRKQSNNIQLTGRFKNTQTPTNTETSPLASTVKRVKIVREDGVIKYSYNDEEPLKVLADKNLVSATEHFDTTVWFGGYPLDSNNTPMQRPLNGTLSDMYIKLAK